MAEMNEITNVAKDWGQMVTLSFEEFGYVHR